MKTLKAKRAWLKEKLLMWGKKVDVEGLEKVIGATDQQLKNKIDSLKRKGRNYVKKHVVPYMKTLQQELRATRSMLTGSAAVEGGSLICEFIQLTNLQDRIDQPTGN